MDVFPEVGLGRPAPPAPARWPKVWRWTRRVVDAALIAAIFIIGARWAADFEVAWRAEGNVAQFYQHYFEASVMIACGHGFVVAEPRTQVPGLQEFLNQKVDAFDCARIPRDVVLRSEGIPQQAWYYLIRTVGLTWSLVGVSWSGLTPLFGVLYGVVLVVIFGLFRLGTGRVLATAATAAVGISSLHLINLPHLRDYAKAPFVLALLLIMALAVVGSASRRRVLGLAALAGAVLGIGYGFRTDLLANIPPLLLTFAVFIPGGWRQHLRLKAAAMGVILATFLVIAWPVVSYVTRQGGCQWHVALLGLSSYFDDDLGIRPASYDWGPYSDEYMHGAVGSFYVPGADSDVGPSFCGPEYDRQTARYLASIAITFPGDVATRALAALAGVLNLPSAHLDPPLKHDDRQLYRDREAWLGTLDGWAPILTLPLLCGIAYRNARVGLWAFAMLLWFGGMTMLQFDRRHHFHYEWMGWFVFAATLSWVGNLPVAGLRRLWRGEPDPSPRSGLKGVAILLAAVAGVGGLIVGARAYQRAQVTALVPRVLSLTNERLVTVDRPEGEGFSLTPVLPHRRDHDPRFFVEYLRIDLAADRCRGGAVVLRYSPPYHDGNRSWAVTPHQTAILAPVYRGFKDILEPAPGCVKAVYRAPSASMLPGWLYIAVPSDISTLRATQSYPGPDRLYQIRDTAQFAYRAPRQFARWVSDQYDDLRVPAAERWKVYAKPPEVPVTIAEMERQVVSIHSRSFSHRSVAAHAESPGWRIVEGAEGPFAYLLASRQGEVRRDWRLLVRGTIAAGGVTVGLIQGGRWLDQVNVLQPGRFAVVIEPSEPGPVDVIIANNESEGAPRTRAYLDTIAWIGPSSGPPRTTPGSK